MKKIIPIVLLCYLCIIKSQSLFKWNNITVTLSQRTILSLGPGEIQSGRVLGILGPSGSGKTTFLNVLADRVPNNKQINLISDIKSDLVSSDIAFVYQQDSFFPLFTVKESLKLSALLTLKYSNKYLPKLNINTLINDLLNSLSISHIGNSFIGSMDDDSNRGISGGERKRLAIAKEMIKSPPLLILDEPTSGLDAYQALYVMEVLRNLTQYKNLAVVCTIHQPRSSIWNLLDDVIILSPLGKPVYFGSKENVTRYFSSIGYPIPSNTNPAEYLIDLVSFDNTNQYTRNITVQRTQLLVNKFIEFSTRNNLDKLIDTSIDKLVDNKIDVKTEKLIDKKVDKSSVKPSNTLTDKSVDKPVDESIEKSIGQSITIQSNKSVNTKNKFSLFRLISNNVKKIKNSIGRISLLLQRSFLQIIRDVSSNLGQIGVNSILSLVIYAVYGRQSSAITVESVSGRIMIIANSVIMVCMTSLIKTLQLFKKGRTVIVREKSQGQYSSFEYLLSKVLSELPWNSLITSLFGVTIHRLTNLNSYLPTFLTTLSLLNFATSTLGLAIGSIFQRGDEALSIGPGVMIVFLIIGAIGPTGASAKLPWYLEPLRNLSPIKWGCESLIAAELGGKTFYHPKPIIKGPFGSIRIVLSTIFEFIKLIPLIIKSKTVGVSNLIDGDETLKSLNVPLDSAKTSISSLAVMTLVHICIAFFGLVSHKS